MKKIINNNIEILIASFLLSFTIGLCAPLELYFGNFDDFWFGLSLIWYIPVCVFLFIILGALGLGVLLPDRFKPIYASLITAIGLCFYLQSNFLNLNVGIFDGKKIDWEIYRTSFIRNIIIWLVVIIIFTIVINISKIKPYRKIIIGFICAMLCGMQFTGLVSLIVPVVNRGDNVWVKSQKMLSNKDLFEVGTDENIIVLILDSFDDSYFQEVLDEKGEVYRCLDGFTYYSNHAGMFASTRYAMHMFLDGNVFLNQMSRSEWIDYQESQYNYYDLLKDDGYNLSMYTTEEFNIPHCLLNELDNYVDDYSVFTNDRTKFSLLYKMVMCKYFPDIINKYAWLDGTEFINAAMSTSEYRLFNGDNVVFKDDYNKNNGITVADGKKCYKLIHLYGAHEPYHIDEFGNEADAHYDGEKMRKGLWNIVMPYLEDLKEKGVYDKSSIIISADHGCTGTSTIMDNPFMLIKPSNSRGELKISKVPSSHADIAATIIDLAGCKDYVKFGESILRISEDEKRDRFFYAYSFAPEDDWKPTFINENFALTEYFVPNETNDPWKYVLTDVEITPMGKRIKHSDYCESCADGTEQGEYAYWPTHRHVWTKNYPRN